MFIKFDLIFVVFCFCFCRRGFFFLIHMISIIKFQFVCVRVGGHLLGSFYERVDGRECGVWLGPQPLSKLLFMSNHNIV